MGKFKTALSLLSKPREIIPALARNGLLKWVPDKTALYITYWCNTGERLDLINPVTYNEKLQWLKLFDRRPEYTEYADKYAVRSYVSKKIGKTHLIPIIGVFERVEDIPWESLPNQFVLKCTHGSGCNIICDDKAKLNRKDSIKKLNRWMKTNYYWKDREWPYKDITPRILCEKYLVDESRSQLKDYKVFCFKGKAEMIQVHYDRFKEHKRSFYTPNWKYINASLGDINETKFRVPKPQKLDRILEFAEKLAENIPHVRVDFYSIYETIYFGEMTFYHAGGYLKFDPPELGVTWGERLKLDKLI